MADNVKEIEIGQMIGFNDIIDFLIPVGTTVRQFPGEPTPAEKYPGTSWEIDITMQGRVIIGSGGAYVFGATGGSANAVVVAHSHSERIAINGAETNLLKSVGGVSEKYGYAFGNVAISEGSGSSVSTNSTGESGEGKNMPPYIVVNFWKRTA